MHPVEERDVTDSGAGRLRVGLFGRLGSGNIGNDATMEAMLAYLKAEHAGAAIDCLCSGPDDVIQRYGLPASQMHWLHVEQRTRPRLVHAVFTAVRIVVGALIDAWRTATWVRQHDVVIMPGMGTLESTLPKRPWQLPYSMFLVACFGRLFGTKVAFVCVGASIVRERITGWLLTTAARLAYYRSFRDDQSLDAARTMGMASDRDHVYPDLVFALPTPGGPVASSRTVGVGVMAYFGGPADRARATEIYSEYVEKMTQFVRWLLETGHRVRLLIGDREDEAVARTILADVRTHWQHSSSPPVIYESVVSIHDVMSQLAPLDAVVATRFHNVLAALKCAKPTVAIGYGKKHSALMTQLGVGNLIQDIRSFDVEHLKEQFTELEADRGRVARTLSERNERNRILLERQFAELTGALFTPAGRRPRSAVQ